MSKVKLVISISKEIKAKLHELARLNHRTMTGQIEYMIEKAVKQDED